MTYLGASPSGIFKPEGFAYIDLLSHKGGNKCICIRMLDIPDKAHLTKNIRNGTEFVIQLRLTDIAEITAKNLCSEQDEEPARFSAFRSGLLSVSAMMHFIMLKFFSYSSLSL